MLIDGDEFIEKPAETLNSVEKFLNIPKFFSTSNFVFIGEPYNQFLTLFYRQKRVSLLSVSLPRP